MVKPRLDMRLIDLMMKLTLSSFTSGIVPNSFT